MQFCSFSAPSYLPFLFLLVNPYNPSCTSVLSFIQNLLPFLPYFIFLHFSLASISSARPSPLPLLHPISLSSFLLNFTNHSFVITIFLFSLLPPPPSLLSQSQVCLQRSVPPPIFPLTAFNIRGKVRGVPRASTHTQSQTCSSVPLHHYRLRLFTRLPSLCLVPGVWSEKRQMTLLESKGREKREAALLILL